MVSSVACVFACLLVCSIDALFVCMVVCSFVSDREGSSVCSLIVFLFECMFTCLCVCASSSGWLCVCVACLLVSVCWLVCLSVRLVVVVFDYMFVCLFG